MSAVRSLRLALDIAKALDPSEEDPGVYCEPIIVVPASAPDPMPSLPKYAIRDVEQANSETVTYDLGFDGASVRVVRMLPREVAPDPEVDGAPGYHYCPACRHVLVSNLIEASGRRSLGGVVCCSDCSDDMMDAEQAAAAEQETLRQEARAEWRLVGEDFA